MDISLGAVCGNVGSSELVFFYRTEFVTTEFGVRHPDEHDNLDSDVTAHITEFNKYSFTTIINCDGTGAKLHHQHPGDVRQARTAELFMG